MQKHEKKRKGKMFILSFFLHLYVLHDQTKKFGFEYSMQCHTTNTSSIATDGARLF